MIFTAETKLPAYTTLFDGKKGALSLKNTYYVDITHGN